MKMLFKNLSSLIPVFLACVALPSCMSTETIEEVTSNEGELSPIFLNLNAPKIDGTRADDSHLLRYTAKLFKGSPSNLDVSSMERKELIEGNTNELGNENQIIFYLDPNTRYTIFVFADYVPSEKGLAVNTDHYFDTSVSNSYYDMYTKAGSGKITSDLGEDFFNNEHYDCFCGVVTDQKSEGKNVHDLTLKRVMGKVRFVDTSGISGNFTISSSRLQHYTRLTVSQSTSGALNLTSHSPSSLTIADNVNLSPDKDGNTELFYYYTFANPGENQMLDNSINFKITDNRNGETMEFKVTEIKVRQNYVTTVRGHFLPSAPLEEEPQPEPGPDKDGNVIILNLSTDSDQWGQNVKDWTQE